MTLKNRLAKLEVRLNTALEEVIVYCINGVFNEEQQARIDQAKSEGVPVEVIEYEIIE